MSRVDRACYAVAAALVLSGLLHLAILIVSGDGWTGPVSWRKPATFGLSFGVTLATITWVSGFVPLAARARRRLLAAFALACVVEVFMITMQRWRGLPSHFIPATSPSPLLNGLVAVGAAAGAVLIVVVSVALTVAAFRAMPDQPPEMRLAVRVGLASFLLALAVGVVMLGVGQVLTRTVDVTSAFAYSGGLKPGHAATMHGVLVLPVLARLLAAGRHDERRRLAVMRVACLGYLLFAGIVVVECFAGIDPWLPGTAAVPVLTTALALAGAVTLGAAGLVALTGLRRPAGA